MKRNYQLTSEQHFHIDLIKAGSYVPKVNIAGLSGMWRCLSLKVFLDHSFRPVAQPRPLASLRVRVNPLAATPSFGVASEDGGRVKCHHKCQRTGC